MNNESRNGVHGRPSLPIVCITISFSMNVTLLSARLRTPVGATSGSLRPASRNTTMPIRAASTAMSPTLLKLEKMSLQRINSLIGGNFNASIPRYSYWPATLWTELLMDEGLGFRPG